jgi:hypothetical protein
VRPGFGLWEKAGEAGEADGEPAGKSGGGTTRAPAGELKAHMFSHPDLRLPCHVRLWITSEEASLWHEARRLTEIETGERLEPWETLFIIVRSFLAVWDDHRLARMTAGHKILERDGWQCAVPGCSSRRGLEIHHIRPRARGGSNDPSNLITVCSSHHRGIIHEGRLTCRGEAPGKVVFVFDVRGGRVSYRGDVREAETTPSPSR